MPASSREPVWDGSSENDFWSREPYANGREPSNEPNEPPVKGRSCSGGSPQIRPPHGSGSGRDFSAAGSLWAPLRVGVDCTLSTGRPYPAKPPLLRRRKGEKQFGPINARTFPVVETRSHRCLEASRARPGCYARALPLLAPLGRPCRLLSDPSGWIITRTNPIRME